MTQRWIGREGYNGQDVVVWRKNAGYHGTIVAVLTQNNGERLYKVKYRSGTIVTVSGSIMTSAGGSLPPGNGR